MTQLFNTNLYTGSKYDLSQTNETDWAFVHATKTLHQDILGYFKALPINHSNYIFFEKNNHLYVNWVDTLPKYFDFQGKGVENITRVLNLIDKWINSRKVFVHFDQGASRGPTTALAYLAKRSKKISNVSFESAKNDSDQCYRNYYPRGMGEFVQEKWNLIK